MSNKAFKVATEQVVFGTVIKKLPLDIRKTQRAIQNLFGVKIEIPIFDPEKQSVPVPSRAVVVQKQGEKFCIYFHKGEICISGGKDYLYPERSSDVTHLDSLDRLIEYEVLCNLK